MVGREALSGAKQRVQGLIPASRSHTNTSCAYAVHVRRNKGMRMRGGYILAL